MNLFKPVGHTDEWSASLGVGGRFTSPFSPFFDAQAGGHRTNPPLSSAERFALEGSGSSAETVTPVQLTLAMGGLIVNKQWDAVVDMCRHMVIRSKKKGSPTWGPMFHAIGQFAQCLHEGREPVRAASTKAEKAQGHSTISLWTDVARSALAAKGNVKLPFAAYSEMPAVTCPGAGGVTGRFGLLSAKSGTLGAAVESPPDSTGCASFCYSFKALRYADVSGRMLLLTMGFSVDPVRHVSTVYEQMRRLVHARSPTKILRLFVDGDFRSEEAIQLWMDGCVRPLAAEGVKVYGYSKSWHHFIAVDRAMGSAWWPSNYALNISSGSRFAGDSRMMAAMKDLPIARGEFVAVDPLERLLWKAFTKSRGERVYAAYGKRLNGIMRLTKGNKRKAAALRTQQQIGRMIRRANPDLANSYDDYVLTVHAVEDAKASKTVLAQVEKITGEASPAGVVAQAATWAFLRSTADKGEVACPISCGACPLSAIAKHEHVIATSLAPAKDDLVRIALAGHLSPGAVERVTSGARDTDELSKIVVRYKTDLTEKAKASGMMHLCGKKTSGKPTIIIGIH